MPFPVDILNNCTHEDLETSGRRCMAELLRGNPDSPEFFPLPNQTQVPIKLSSVGFVPLYGEDQSYKVLALFSPQDFVTAAALYLADKWWSIDEIVRTSVPTRQGICQVNSIGERIVLYVLNRIIYRKQEIEEDETPFLCHTSNAYAKILWEGGEAVGFYSVKPKGSTFYAPLNENYYVTVLDSFFVRKQYRDKGSGLLMLKDFVDSFNEKSLGVRYPLSAFMFGVCKQYIKKYPEDCNRLWEVEGAGRWYQRKSIHYLLKKQEVSITEASEDKTGSGQAVDDSQQSAAVAGTSRQNVELEAAQNTDSQKAKQSVAPQASTSQDPVVSPAASWMRFSHFKRARTGKTQEYPCETFYRDEGRSLPGSKSRLEFRAPALEAIEEVPEESSSLEDEKMLVANESQSVPEAEPPVPSSEKGSEKEETPSEPFNGEVIEDTGKTVLTDEVETANEVLSGESKLQLENPEKPLMLFLPKILESKAKPSEDTVSEKVLNANDSEVVTEEGKSVEKEGTEEQQESKKSTTESAAALASKEELSDNDLPKSTGIEVEESASENVSPKTASSLEDQNEEAGYNSQEPPGALSQSSLTMVEVAGVSFQQPSGQEGQKNQLEEHSEESAEYMDQYTQTAMERAADSSSEEAEIEVPIVDRRNLRRKAKGYKGPPKKKGKPS
ncbi:soluble lamin-associated protein of 75 kDa [Dryobates pubescens]|uniref:soluble lamin-associated protein of 75 kDa n=1 Tax=Dryobates pubescens TaxID=118200 RepID=UPI0023B88D71|nr:soluble lamin-associated protein of 75 kDa [Dryobates pubescens]